MNTFGTGYKKQNFYRVSLFKIKTVLEFMVVPHTFSGGLHTYERPEFVIGGKMI